jgi:hypothetical protein
MVFADRIHGVVSGSPLAHLLQIGRQECRGACNDGTFPEGELLRGALPLCALPELALAAA